MELKKIFIVGITAISIVGCGGTEESTKVKALQKKDKRLSCEEILLEMNEADFYRKMAYKNKGPKLKSVLMPLGYISTYMDAEEAIDAAEARVSYLEKVYEIMRCEQKEEERESMPLYMPQGSIDSKSGQQYGVYGFPVEGYSR